MLPRFKDKQTVQQQLADLQSNYKPSQGLSTRTAQCSSCNGWLHVPWLKIEVANEGGANNATNHEADQERKNDEQPKHSTARTNKTTKRRKKKQATNIVAIGATSAGYFFRNNSAMRTPRHRGVVQLGSG